MKKTEILHAVNLSVPKGAVFGFLGANGAGKTTLIHLIAGLRKPVRGSVSIGGHEATLPQARAMIGYLPERPYFHEHLTGERMLHYFGSLSGMHNDEIDRRIPLVLDEVGLGDHGQADRSDRTGGKPPRKLELKRYSKGMLQRIGIAQALLHNPEILILDEPMSGLDPLGRKDIRELMLSLAGKGKTIFFSTHVIPDVEAICNQVGLIEKGRITGCGSIKDLLGGKTFQTEIAFTGLEQGQASTVPGLQAPAPIPEGFRGVAPDDESVQKALAALVALKARILWVTPIRSSLEDLFKKTGGLHP